MSGIGFAAVSNIIKEGPVDTVFNSPDHAYTRALLAALLMVEYAARVWSCMALFLPYPAILLPLFDALPSSFTLAIMGALCATRRVLCRVLREVCHLLTPRGGRQI
jgi:hypothetical protein